MTLANGKKLSAASGTLQLAAAERRETNSALARWPPAPGLCAGRNRILGSDPASNLFETGAGNIRMNPEGLLANIADAGKVAPFQPWAKGLYEYRQRNLLKDDPMASCLPPGGPRQFQARQRDSDRRAARAQAYLCDVRRRQSQLAPDQSGWPRPSSRDEVTPTYYGDSVGKWEGDTLVDRHASVSTSDSGSPTAACRTPRTCI